MQRTLIEIGISILRRVVTIVMPRHCIKVIIGPRRKPARCAYASTGDRHKSGTILANEMVHLPSIVARRLGWGTERNGRAAGMHRNCAHCLMHARRLESAVTPPGFVCLNSGRLDALRCGRKRASMIYRLSSRVTRVSSSATDESFVVMDREWLLVRGDPSFRGIRFPPPLIAAPFPHVFILSLVVQ